VRRICSYTEELNDLEQAEHSCQLCSYQIYDTKSVKSYDGPAKMLKEIFVMKPNKF